MIRLDTRRKRWTLRNAGIRQLPVNVRRGSLYCFDTLPIRFIAALLRKGPGVLFTWDSPARLTYLVVSVKLATAGHVGESSREMSVLIYHCTIKKDEGGMHIHGDEGSPTLDDPVYMGRDRPPCRQI